MSAPTPKPAEQWRPVPGARAEVSNLGHVRDKLGKALEADDKGRVIVNTTSGLQPRTIASMLRAAFPELDAAAHQRIQRRRRRERRRTRLRPIVLTPAWAPKAVGPTNTAVLLSVARGEALAREKGRPWQPHPGDQYARRVACTHCDRTDWLENELPRYAAWVDAVVHLEDAVQRASEAERERVEQDLSRQMKALSTNAKAGRRGRATSNDE